MLKLDVKFSRPSKVYYPGESIKGIIQLNSPSEFRHDGICVAIEGKVMFQSAPKNVGLFDSFQGSNKSISLVHAESSVSPAAKVTSGITNIPFQIEFNSSRRVFHESYHGVCITVQYALKCQVKNRTGKHTVESAEFLVEYETSEKEGIFYRYILSKLPLDQASPLTFAIDSESVRKNTPPSQNIPNFRITGHFSSQFHKILQPLSGELIVKYCEFEIKSLELQFVRVETRVWDEEKRRDDTEIQNLQMADGDVLRNVTIPIYMLFPRLFTCPTVLTPEFKIETVVEVNGRVRPYTNERSLGTLNWNNTKITPFYIEGACYWSANPCFTGWQSESTASYCDTIYDFVTLKPCVTWTDKLLEIT